MKTNTLSMPVQVNYMQTFSTRFVAFVKWLSVP